jgi:hypothetical protein
MQGCGSNADPDPAFFLISYPDPVPNPGLDQKLKKNLQLKKNWIFYDKKIATKVSLGHKGRTSYRRSLQPSKKNIQHFKTLKFFTFFKYL